MQSNAHTIAFAMVVLLISSRSDCESHRNWKIECVAIHLIYEGLRKCVLV